MNSIHNATIDNTNLIFTSLGFIKDENLFEYRYTYQTDEYCLTAEYFRDDFINVYLECQPSDRHAEYRELTIGRFTLQGFICFFVCMKEGFDAKI